MNLKFISQIPQKNILLSNSYELEAALPWSAFLHLLSRSAAQNTQPADFAAHSQACELPSADWRGGRRFKLDMKNFSEACLPFISNNWLLMGLKRRQVTSLRDLGNFVDNLPFLSNISMFDCFIEFTSNKSGVQGLRHFVRQQAISVASQVAEKLKVWDSN